MKKLLLICLVIPALAYSFTYKNNPQTGKPDLVTTTVADLTDIGAGYVASSVFANYTGIDRVPATRTVNGQALTGDVTVTTITGNAGTATALQTPRTINGVSFDGTANITVADSTKVTLAGAAGGQTINGGTAASETLTLKSTAHATKGKILFGTSAYDEVNNRLGVGTASPGANLDIFSAAAGQNPTIRLQDADTAGIPIYAGITPAPTTNTIGFIGPFSGNTGGIAFVGFTNNTAATVPLYFAGYHGSTAPTAAALFFTGYKTAGGTSVQALGATEKVVEFTNNYSTPLVTIFGSGATTFVQRITSTLATGTSPFAVTSTTINTNLNADYLDGQHGSYYAPLASPVFTTPVRLKGYTVATLPAGTEGDTAYATDLLLPAFFALAVGGGAVKGPVFYDGTQWITY